MAQGSRQIQSQAQQQIQTLSPQQILVVKLLELPAVELEDRVHAELLENPALEEGKEESTSDETTPAETSEGETEGDTDYDSLSDYLTEDDIPDYKLQENNRSKGEQAEEIPFSDATSFYEILREQLGERNLTEHQRELAEYLRTGHLRRYQRYGRGTGGSPENRTRFRPSRTGRTQPAGMPADTDPPQKTVPLHRSSAGDGRRNHQ